MSDSQNVGFNFNVSTGADASVFGVNQLPDVLGIVKSKLQLAANDSSFIAQVFGDKANTSEVQSIIGEWKVGVFGQLPSVQVISAADMNGADGAYANSTQKIYLSDALFQSGAAPVNSVLGAAGVLTEETFHWLDDLVGTDTQGDEGELAKDLLFGVKLSDSELSRIKAESDRGVISVAGKSILVEQASIIGNNLANTLIGTNLADVIYGYQGSDTLNGNGGNDLLNGYGSTDNERDTLTGGSGSDRFVLGDANSVFYAKNGNSDYAMITDFNRAEGDAISLKKLAFNSTSGDRAYGYRLVTVGVNTEIRVDNTNELVATLQNRTGVSLLQGFVFEGTPSFGNNGSKFVNQMINLSAFNFPDMSIRHRNALGEISKLQSELDYNDGSFMMVRGLADPNAISFESVNFPGYYLRHENSQIKLAAKTNSQLFREDATFYQANGLADSGAFSFESYNYRGYYIRHQNSKLYISKVDGTDLFNKDSTFKISIAENTKVNLKSLNYPDSVIRHQNSLGEITQVQSQLDYNDASFKMVRGLADPNAISFESVNFPGYYLRHEGGRVKLAAKTNTQLFKEDATFYQVSGLGSSEMSSFESYNFRGYYIRHQNGHLYIGQNDRTNLFSQDATFDVVCLAPPKAPSGLMATSSYLTQLSNGTLIGKYSKNVDNANGYQCWDLVADAAGINSSSPYYFADKWKRGENVIANGNVAVGTAIATFAGTNNSYYGAYNHTGIFAGYRRNSNGVIDGFWMWEQNAPLGSTIRKGFYSITNNGVSDGDNYYVVRA